LGGRRKGGVQRGETWRGGWCARCFSRPGADCGRLGVARPGVEAERRRNPRRMAGTCEAGRSESGRAKPNRGAWRSSLRSSATRRTHERRADEPPTKSARPNPRSGARFPRIAKRSGRPADSRSTAQAMSREGILNPGPRLRSRAGVARAVAEGRTHTAAVICAMTSTRSRAPGAGFRESPVLG